MNRRDFLTAGAGTLAAAAALGRTTRAQRARQPDPAKLERIAIMTLAFNAILKLPNQPASPNRTLEVLDIPEMLADEYGVHNIEFQHEHLASTERAYLGELRARLERSKSRMSNVNLEFGPVNISAADPALRQQAVDMTRQWIDHAVTLGCPRVMINQGSLTEETKTWAIAALRQMGEYGRSKGIKVSAETRLVFGPGRGGARGQAAPGTAPQPAPAGAPAPAAAAATPAVPGAQAPMAPGARAAGAAPAPRPILTAPPTWVLLAELIKNSDTYSTVDLGNVNAQDQGELHAALRTLLPMTVGSIHTRVSPAWDLATALRFMTVNLQYSGLFSIEAFGHNAVRNIYNIVLDTI
jgi:hypothetical protein